MLGSLAILNNNESKANIVYISNYTTGVCYFQADFISQNSSGSCSGSGAFGWGAPTYVIPFGVDIVAGNFYTTTSERITVGLTGSTCSSFSASGTSTLTYLCNAGNPITIYWSQSTPAANVFVTIL